MEGLASVATDWSLVGLWLEVLLLLGDLHLLWLLDPKDGSGGSSLMDRFGPWALGRGGHESSLLEP